MIKLALDTSAAAKAFGETMRERRVLMGMRQKQLANALGYCASFVSGIETGDRMPHPDFCSSLAKLDPAIDWHRLGARAQGWEISDLGKKVDNR